MLVDKARTWAFYGLHSHIAILAPSWTPRVSDDEVLHVFLHTVADDVHLVVDSGTTVLIRQDALFVIHESRIACRNSDGQNTLAGSGLDRAKLVSWTKHLVRLHFDDAKGIHHLLVATGLLRFVRVVPRSDGGMLLEVIEGCELPASAASSVWRRRTVDELLLGEVLESA